DPARGIAGPDLQLVVEKIKFNFEDPLAIRNGPRGKPARAHMQRDIPPVVLPGRELETNLADHLHPHVQGIASVLPGVWTQLGPARRCVRNSSVAGLSFDHGAPPKTTV